jgi:phage terminase large subunit
MTEETKKEINRRFEAFKKRIPVYRKDPVMYCKEVIGFVPDEWQEAVFLIIPTECKLKLKKGKNLMKKF